MAFDEQLARRVRRALDGRTDVVEKHMFGGVCFMVRGRMACGIVGDALMVRLDVDDAQRLVDEPHVRPMDFTGRPMRGFLFVDAPATATPRALARWVQRTVDFTESRPAAATRAATPKRSSGVRGRSPSARRPASKRRSKSG